MHVSQLRIEKFRGIKRATINLESHTVLLGPNNVGKSAIIEALTLLLGRRHLYRQLGEYDFFGGAPSATARINIVAVITGFRTNSPADYPELFNLNRGTPYWWCPSKHRVEAEESEDSDLALQVALTARYDKDDLAVEAKRYFFQAATDPFEEPALNSLSRDVRRRIGYFLLPANRTWERTLSFGSELFRQVLLFQEALPSDELHALRDWLCKPAISIENAPSLQPIIGRVNKELAGFLGSQASNLKLIPSYGDIEGVLDVLYPYLTGKDESLFPIGRHGSGTISLQTLLLLLEFGRARLKSNQNFMLAAEEPELHLHPGQHRRLVARMHGVSTQTIVTTHSPEIAAYYQPNQILFLKNDDGELVAEPLLPSSERVPDRNALMRLYTLYRSEVCEALMHSRVLLPEGQTEFRWLRALTSACVTTESQAQSPTNTPALGVLPVQSASVVATFKRLSKVNGNLLPMVDGDAAGSSYVKQLTGLASPPQYLAQFGPNQTFENFLAWVIAADDALLDEVAEVLSIQDINAENLPALLRHEAVKTRWDYHEQISSLIAGSAAAGEMARAFLDACSKLSAGQEPSQVGWHQDSEATTAKTAVWRFDTSSA